MYKPDAMSNGQPAFAVELAEVARQKPLAIYAGAGLSQASPTDIPGGAEVARRCHARLVDALGPDVLDCNDPSNLTSVADAAAKVSGVDLIRHIAASVADFTLARPNFSHEVLALLLLEGMVVVITTNWDDCIERAGGEERVLAVISDQDRQQIQMAALLKVHGCATRPTTVLVTTTDLAEPAPWARDEVNVRLSDSQTVFVGISDVAGYVRTRIQEAKEAIGTGGSDLCRVAEYSDRVVHEPLGRDSPRSGSRPATRSYVRRVLGSSYSGLRSANAPRHFLRP